MSLLNYELLNRLKTARTVDDLRGEVSGLDVSSLLTRELVVYTTTDISFFIEVISILSAVYGIDLRIKKIESFEFTSHSASSPLLVLTEDLSACKDLFLSSSFGSESDYGGAIAHVLEEIGRFLAELRQRCPGRPIFLTTLPPELFPIGGIQSDYQSLCLDAAIMEINLRIKKTASEYGCFLIHNRYYTTYEKSFFGLGVVTDTASNSLPFEYYPILNFCLWVLHHIYPVFFQRIKAISIDLDDTLWKGKIAEDGDSVIGVFNDDDRFHYSMLQHHMSSLASQGVIMGVVSRNEVARVEQSLKAAIADRRFLFEPSVIEASMRDRKSALIERMCKRLGGIDSSTVLFIDNSDIERAEVFGKSICTVARFPNSIREYEMMLLLSPFIEKTVIDSTDKERAIWFHEKSRGSLRFETGLVAISGEHLEKNRILDLIAKTNQFNFTTQRLSDVDLDNIIASGKFLVFGLNAIPSEGSNLKESICGVMIVETSSQKVWIIENFIVSCRYMGLDIDSDALRQLVGFAAKREVKYIIGKFKQTQRNGILRDWYVNHGFIRIEPEKECDLFRAATADLGRLDFSPQRNIYQLKSILSSRKTAKNQICFARRRQRDSSEEVLVNEGVFRPGISIEDARIINSYFGIYPENEINLDEVRTDGYFMDKYCITNYQYSLFLNLNYDRSERALMVDEMKSLQPESRLTVDSRTKDVKPIDGKSSFPAIVPYAHAERYGSWVEARMPTEWEWEWAARGQDGRWFPWGYKLPEIDMLLTNNKSECSIFKNPKNISPFGVVGMVGNVWQWCNNEFNSHQQYRGSDYRYDSYYWKRVTLRPIESAEKCGNIVGFRLIRSR